MAKDDIVARLDAEVDDFAKRAKIFQPGVWTKGRCRAFVYQHRLNTRQRNSVLKLRVATNCPIWDIKLDIIHACAQEIIADDEFGGGQAHWQILEDLGVKLGMDRTEIQNAKPRPSTELCWDAWSGLMSNSHWLLGLIGNTCAERPNVPGYGNGAVREKGWFGMMREDWSKVWDLPDENFGFFQLHTEADIEHSELGWKNVAEYAADLKLEDEVIVALRRNLAVWEHYTDGILEYGDTLG